MPASLFRAGRVGIISRSGTLSYELAGILSESDVGQSAVVGMGADPVVLTNLSDILQLFEEDPDTDGVDNPSGKSAASRKSRSLR